jgi:MFS transporter, OFA family, oxalate/formate antiporter
VHIPFAPRQCPFFYGWVIVLATTLGTIASIPGQTMGVGVFTDKLMQALGLTRTQLSSAYMMGTIASSLLLPWAGSLTDRLGTRVMVVISALGLGLSLLIMSFTAVIPTLVNTSLLCMALMAGGFFLIRFFGQGCLTLVSRVTIAKWFNHRRGLATGMANIVVSYSFNASPALLNALVLSVGWESAYRVLGAIICLGMAGIGWLLYRDNPEQCGLVMDGRDDAAWIKKVAARVPQTARQFTRSEAVKTGAFWSYALPLAWQALFMTAVTFHITSMGEEFGLSRTQCYALFPLIGLISVAGAVVAGWFSDHIRLKWLLQITVISQFVSALGLYDLSTMAGKALFVTGFGIAGGLFGLLLTIVWPRYFGRAHLGAINGLTSSILVFASAIGPYMFSSLRDLSGSYQGVVVLSGLVPLLLFVPAILVKNPQSEALKTN